MTKPSMPTMPVMPVKPIQNKTQVPPPPTIPLSRVTFGKIKSATGHRVILFGPGGIGKTTLAAGAPGPVAFIDLDESLPRLNGTLEASGLNLNICPVDGVDSWADMRSVLQSDGWEEIKTIVIDTGTKAEELAIAYTLATVKTEKGTTPRSIEEYGYGKGYQHVYETFLTLLPDLDRHSREGRNVIIICHDCTNPVPNPSGEDWLRYEPRLQSSNSGKSSIRLRAREWADHVLFMGYDVSVDKNGKGSGSGTRTIYTSELPHCMAKSRTTTDTIPVDGSDIWNLILK